MTSRDLPRRQGIGVETRRRSFDEHVLASLLGSALLPVMPSSIISPRTNTPIAPFALLGVPGFGRRSVRDDRIRESRAARNEGVGRHGERNVASPLFMTA